MVSVNDRDCAILHLLLIKRETRFKELEESNMMAKSTLSKHLTELRRNGLIRKTFSEAADCDVYIITAKGKRAYSERVGKPVGKLEDFL